MTALDNRIVIFRGDDTDFVSGDEIELTICTSLDLTNCKAHLKFLDFQHDWELIPEDNILKLAISHDITKEFPFCSVMAKLWVTNSNDKIRTIQNDILVTITNKIDEACMNSIIREIPTCGTQESLTQDGIFYLPVYKKNAVQFYRQLRQYEDSEFHEVTTELSEDLYVREDDKFVKYTFDDNNTSI